MDHDSRRSHRTPRSLVLAVLALAALTATAGCMGILGGGGSSTPTATPTDGSSGPTTTTADAPTATSTPTDEGGDGGAANGSLPPGITNDGRFDPAPLLVAHKERLSGSSYTMVIQVSRSVETGDGTRNSSDQQVTRVGGDGTFLTRLVRRARFPLTQATWGNGSVAVAQLKVGNRTEYRRRDVERVRGNLTGQGFVQQFLQLGNYSVERINRSSNQVVLSASGSPDDAGIGPNASVESYDGTMVVDFQSRVRRLTANATVQTARGQSAQLQASYVLSAIGRTTVERPDWVEAALDETDPLGSDSDSGSDSESGSGRLLPV